MTLVSLLVPTTLAHEVVPQPKVLEVPIVMEEIAKCESGGSQFYEDGSLIRGKVNPQDVGKWQINEKYHLATAQSMGIDIYTLEGNTEYALYLYETQGVRPWYLSAKCHGHTT